MSLSITVDCGLCHWVVMPPIPWLAHHEEDNPSRLNNNPWKCNTLQRMTHVGPFKKLNLQPHRLILYAISFIWHQLSCSKRVTIGFIILSIIIFSSSSTSAIATLKLIHWSGVYSNIVDQNHLGSRKDQFNVILSFLYHVVEQDFYLYPS